MLTPGILIITFFGLSSHSGDIADKSGITGSVDDSDGLSFHAQTTVENDVLRLHGQLTGSVDLHLYGVDLSGQ